MWTLICRGESARREHPGSALFELEPQQHPGSQAPVKAREWPDRGTNESISCSGQLSEHPVGCSVESSPLLCAIQSSGGFVPEAVM